MKLYLEINYIITDKIEFLSVSSSNVTSWDLKNKGKIFVKK